jgi:drug/metabolite transporter (DMT)-like permease
MRDYLRSGTTHAMLLAAALFWGTNPMVMKLGLRSLNPFAFTSLRLLLGICIATPLAVLTGNWRKIAKADVFGLFAVPLAGFIVFQVFFTVGVSMSSASVASIVLAILPIAVAIISHVVGAERLNGIKVLGVLTTFAGVIAIALGTPEGIDFRGAQVAGVALLVVCEIAFGLYTVYLRPVAARYPVPQITILMMIGAFVPFAAYTLLTLGPSAYAGMDPTGFLSALASGVLALFAANMLWTTGIKRLGSVNTSVYGNLQPVFGVAAAMVVLGDRLGVVQIVGAAVVLAGILLVNRRRQP